MSDDNLNELGRGNCTRLRKTELSRLNRIKKIAVRCLDKPNLLRLRELAFASLPMVGNVSVIGELVHKKARQGLKRAIKLSNNNKGHMFSN